jgi:hypothetical protein
MRWTKRLVWTWPAVCVFGLLCGAVRADGASRERSAWKNPVLLLGAARSTFRVADQPGADPTPLWIPRVGITYNAPRDKVAAFEFGLWVDTRGGEWKDGGSDLKAAASLAVDPAYTHQLRLIYLALPLMMRLSAPGTSLTPYIRGGIAPNYLLIAKGETWETTTGHVTHGYHNVRDRVRSFSLDALVGAGVRTNLASRAFTLEAIYLHGLSDVLKKTPIEARGNPRSRSLQFYLGIGLLRERPAN